MISPVIVSSNTPTIFPSRRNRVKIRFQNTGSKTVYFKKEIPGKPVQQLLITILYYIQYLAHLVR